MKAVVAGAAVKQEYIDLSGGLDLVTPALKTRAGDLIDSTNVVPDIDGGYRICGGYERFDGRPSPSAAAYVVVVVTGLAAVAASAAVTGSTSGATAVAVYAGADDRLVLTKVVGDFDVGETLTVSASAVGVVAAVTESGADTLLEDVTYTADAAEIYRADIGAVPGSGPVRGVCVYKASVYAWRDNAGGTALVMFKATTSGWAAVAGVPSLAPGGRVRTVIHNFSGGAATQKMYGCDGANKAFEFDGTTYTQITSTASPDTPSAVTVHKNRLFLANLGSLFLSSPGDPVTGWAGVGTTPAELGVGDLIKDLLPLPGNNQTSALAVYCANKTSVLYGSDSSTWDMATATPDSGAVAGTAQYIGGAVALDAHGVTSLTATQAYGNFASSTLSEKIKPLITRLAATATASSLLKSQNQYRVWFADGTGIAFRIDGAKAKGACPILYPNPVECIGSGEDGDGAEVTYFGSSNGFVYQAETGTSFDGAEIEAWGRLAFNAVGGPSVNKTWRRLRVDVDVPSYAELFISYEHDYGSADQGAAIEASRSLSGGGGYWDSFTWEGFVWDSAAVEPPVFKLDGTSPNISIIFRSQSRLSLPVAVEGMILHYTPRRLDRRAR